MNPSPFILFIPAYGKGGTGELVRCVTLATAVTRRWPQARIEFLLPGGPGTLQQAPFTSHCHDDDGTSKEQFNNREIERLRPALVVFDGGIRPSSLALCRRLAIRTAYISHHAKARRKAFRIGGLQQLDAHWHQRDADDGALPPLLRLLDGFSTTERLSFDICLATAPSSSEDLPAEVLALIAAPYVLLSPGGGGYRLNGQWVGDLFVEVAERLHAATGIACLTLLGPMHEGSARTRHTLALKQVSPGRLVALMRQAQLVVANGAGSMGEAAAAGCPVVAAPLGAVDQPARIAAYAAAGRVQPAEPTLESLTEQALALLDPVRNAQQRQQLAEAKIVDGIPLMCEAIARLLA
ncbi:MAG: hypothetical protein V4709_05810 [Pseudomonadota bacterium]